MGKERVDYDDIEGYVSQLKELAGDMKNTTDDIKAQIDKIDSSWEGSAASNYISEINNLCDNLPDAIRQMAEATVFLASCSDGYKKIEKDALEQLKELIGIDYISGFDPSQVAIMELSRRLSHDEVVQQRATSSEVTPPDDGNEQEYDYTNDLTRTKGLGLYLGRSIVSSLSKSKDQKKDFKNIKDAKIIPLNENESIKIPTDIKQDGYKLNLYNENRKFESDSNEDFIHKMWEEQNCTTNNNIATIKVKDEERYLVKTSPKYGDVGDSIDIELKDGNTLKCVISETQDISVDSKNQYGIEDSKGNTSIIEFQTPEKNSQIELKFDEKNPITKITNNGNILNNEKTDVKTDTTTNTDSNSTQETANTTSEEKQI